MTAYTAARPPDGSDFARLARAVRQAGLMRRCPRYHAARISAVSVLYAAGWAVFVLVGDSWWTLAVAVFLAPGFGQVALVAHDVAHRQVFRRARATGVAGRLAGAAVGMSYGWWQDKHTRHHAHPHHEGRDPDISPDLLVWSPSRPAPRRACPDWSRAARATCSCRC